MCRWVKNALARAREQLIRKNENEKSLDFRNMIYKMEFFNSFKNLTIKKLIPTSKQGVTSWVARVVGRGRYVRVYRWWDQKELKQTNLSRHVLSMKSRNKHGSLISNPEIIWTLKISPSSQKLPKYVTGGSISENESFFPRENKKPPTTTLMDVKSKYF